MKLTLRAASDESQRGGGVSAVRGGMTDPLRPPPPRCRRFALVPSTEPELRLLHRGLDSWRGIGDIVAGMARQEYDLE